MATPTRTSLALALLAVFAGGVSADTVVKRNGQKVEGEIIEQDADKVVVKTKFGPIEIARSDISEIMSGKTSAQIFKDRWESIDQDDTVALAELAEWCGDNRLSRESKKVYRRIVDVDPDHEVARRALGYVMNEGEWVSKSDLAAIASAKRKADAAAKKAAGKGSSKGSSTSKDKGAGRASLADLGDVSADTKPFLDEIPTHREEDAKTEESLFNFFGQKFSVGTTTHFSIRAQMAPPDVIEHLVLAEKIYVTCNKLFALPADQRMWANPLQIFHVKQQGTFIDLVDWIDAEVSEMGAESKKFFKDGGGMLLSNVPLCAQYERSIPLNEAMAHWIGQNWLHYYSKGAARSWMREGFAMFTSINEYGTNRLYCSTNTKYANNVEIADKNSDSAYQLVCFDIIEGALEKTYPWSEMVQRDLNQLDFADLAKSWSVVDFLMREHLDEFKKYISLLSRYKNEEDALKEAFGWTGAELDEHWEAFVESSYSRTPGG